MKKWMQTLSFRAQFTSEEQMQKVERMAAKDTIVSLNRTVSILIYLEVAIILVWLAYWKLLNNPLNVEEVVAYALLLILSIAARYAIKYVRRDIDERYRSFERIAVCFSFLLILWAAYITYLNTTKEGIFSIMIYFTIVVVIPMSVFLKPVVYYPIQLCGAILVYPIILCCTKEHQADNLTNFTICMLISTVSATSFYNARIKNYKQLLALEELSEKDPVSGLYNQLKLEEKSEEIWKECKQKGQVISCLFCDIDEFKNLNDLYGNRFGEMCIRSVADAIREIPSKEKLYAFRYRNDEFLVILPGVNYADACRWTEQVRDAVSRKLWKKERQVAMNFGVYTACPFEDSSRMEQYILQADRLRYQAKQQGTNCVCSKDDTEDTE